MVCVPGSISRTWERHSSTRHWQQSTSWNWEPASTQRQKKIVLLMLTISVCTEINYDLQVIYTSNLLNILEKLEIEINKYLFITNHSADHFKYHTHCVGRNICAKWGLGTRLQCLLNWKVSFYSEYLQKMKTCNALYIYHNVTMFCLCVCCWFSTRNHNNRTLCEIWQLLFTVHNLQTERKAIAQSYTLQSCSQI